MNNRPPISEGVPAQGPWPATWAIWLGQIFDCLPWKKAINVTATLNFPDTGAHSQTALTVTVAGARQGDAVEVTPYADVAGIVFAGVATASGVVTVYAKNTTAALINPSSMQFRIIVKQN